MEGSWHQRLLRTWLSYGHVFLPYFGVNFSIDFLGPLFAGDFKYEPFLLLLAQRLRAFRRAFVHDADTVCQSWNIAVGNSRATGRLRYLQDMLSLLGWSSQQNMVVTTGSGTWHLGHVDEESLHESAFQSWFSVVGTKIQHKQGMERIQDVDRSFSLLLRRASKQPISSLGNFTAGAALSSKSKRDFLSEEASMCRLCGQEDSQRHRLLFCPGTQLARANLDPQPLLEAPTLLLERMLFSKPATIQAWDDYVDNLCFQDFPVCFEFVHLFTDGSTYGSHDIARSTMWCRRIGTNLILQSTRQGSCQDVSAIFVQSCTQLQWRCSQRPLVLPSMWIAREWFRVSNGYLTTAGIVALGASKRTEAFGIIFGPSWRPNGI